jgi:hypothetical protein
MQEGQFSEIFSLLVAVNHFGQLIGSFSFFCHQLSLENDVKLVALFALPDHVLSLLVSFLLQNIQKLFPE